MKKILKWTGFVVVRARGRRRRSGLHTYSFRRVGAGSPLRRRSAGATLAIPTDAAEIAEGERLAHLAGCMHCHGDNLAGALVHRHPERRAFVAPNVTHSAAATTTTRSSRRCMRKGVKPDGRGVIFMPSEMFRHLRDQDLARIIAFVRSVPQANGTMEKTSSAHSAA